MNEQFSKLNKFKKFELKIFKNVNSPTMKIFISKDVKKFKKN
jgi:hypothetical protein